MELKSFRELTNLTQKDIAIKLETQQSRIAKYESENMAPSVLWLQKYCETLDANPSFILFGHTPHLLSATPKVSTENGYLLNDLCSLFSQEELAIKLREIILEAILNRVQGIIKEGFFTKLLDLIALGDHIRERPFLFLYYIFQIISVAKNKPNIKIGNTKDFIINTINDFKTISWKNQPAFTEKIKQSVIELIQKTFNENECKLLIEQADTVLILLEKRMTPIEIKAHRGVFHA